MQLCEIIVKLKFFVSLLGGNNILQNIGLLCYNTLSSVHICKAVGSIAIGDFNVIVRTAPCKAPCGNGATYL